MDRQITLSHSSPRLSATPLAAPPSCLRTDRLHLLINSFCHTPCCSSFLFMDRQITLAHITPSATPPAAPPSCLGTERLHLLILPLLLLPPVYGWTDYYYNATLSAFSFLLSEGKISIVKSTSRT